MNRQRIRVDSGELNRRELYLYTCAGRTRKLGAFAEQRTYQPHGWPTWIFENSIVGLSSPAIRMNFEAGGRSRPFSVHAGANGRRSLRDFNRPKTIAKPT
jgi:hypothetical protein